MDKLNPKTETIKKILEQSGVTVTIKQFPDSTRTAQEAAEAIGCTIGQIAKSLIFKEKNSDKPVFVIASGTNRVDTNKIKDFLKVDIEKADADFVLKHTGFIIGGVAPIGHKTKTTPIIDKDLLNYEEIWASAGTPHSVFKISPSNLQKITNGQVIDVKT